MSKRRSIFPASLLRTLLLGILGLGILSGCSFKRMAIRQVGNALAGSGGTFASDDDPELIREAVPFSLKLMESLLAEEPRHEGLLLAAASGFTQYAYGFLQQDADRLESEDFAASEQLQHRARKLYLRARDYGLRGLEVAHPGFEAVLREHPVEAVQAARKGEVPLLYWTAAAWGSAIGVSKNRPDLIGEQVIVEALIDRALELDEDFDHGAIHSFLISYEMVRQGGKGNPAELARRHFDQAVALSDGMLAGPYLAYAESVMVQKQDVTQFRQLLDKALAIDPDGRPEWRLVNLIMQERARWLVSRLDELFLVVPSTPSK